MTYNVFGGTLSLTQSINQPSVSVCHSRDLLPSYKVQDKHTEH